MFDEDEQYPGGRHARQDPVGRRGLLKAALVVAAAVPGLAVLADHLLRRGHDVTAPQAAPAGRSPQSPPVNRPLVSRPTQVVLPLAGKVIVLDPGHNPNNIDHLAEIDRLINSGGFLKACNTVGAETDAGFPEWAFNLDVARRARVILRSQGAQVIMTQNGHTPYGPCNNRRAWISNHAHADATIAIHADGGPPEGYGFAALVPLLVISSISDNKAIIKPSGELGEATVRQFAQATGEPLSTYLGADGIQERNDLCGLNLSTVPKIFIECANMRNASDALKVTDPTWRDAAALGIANSIKAFVLR